jgi:hypothetical protein
MNVDFKFEKGDLVRLIGSTQVCFVIERSFHDSRTVQFNRYHCIYEYGDGGHLSSEADLEKVEAAK